jgi:hypothetical protein
MAGFACRRAHRADLSHVGGYDGHEADRKCLPTLVEFLTRDVYEDGSSRALGTLKIQVQEGVLRAVLTDREEGLVAFVTLDGLVACLDTLEGVLAGDKADWRVDKYAQAKRKK